MLGTQRLAAAGRGAKERFSLGATTARQIDFVTSSPKFASLLAIAANTGAIRGRKRCCPDSSELWKITLRERLVINPLTLLSPSVSGAGWIYTDKTAVRCWRPVAFSVSL